MVGRAYRAALGQLIPAHDTTVTGLPLDSRPTTSNLNWVTGQTAANGAFAGGGDWVAFYNGGSAGADVILDASGYFESWHVDSVL